MRTITKHDIVFAGGFTQADLDMVERACAPLLTRLDTYDPADVTVELSIKERDGSDPRTTLELWVPNLDRMVATSSHRRLPVAVREVANQVLTQLTTGLERQEPMRNRFLRRPTVRVQRTPARLAS